MDLVENLDVRGSGVLIVAAVLLRVEAGGTPRIVRCFHLQEFHAYYGARRLDG